MNVYLIVVILGIVEGITEYLPISSTAHLILAGKLLGYENKTFHIFIQLGAVLAVLWEYRRHLWQLASRAPRDPAARGFLGKLFLAFLPAAIVGLLVHKYIEEHLFHQIPIALAFIVGGVAMFAVEMVVKRKPEADVEKITWSQALGVGLFQVLGMWPGVSRSGATIVGGLVLGLDRPSATMFSFYLALPTLGAATLYSLYKARHDLNANDAAELGVGLVISFVVSLFVIRGLLRYVRSHDFKPFAVYRVALGALILLLPATVFERRRDAMWDKLPAYPTVAENLNRVQGQAGSLSHASARRGL